VYANFFGLRELPFNNTPDPRFFYPTPDHEEALATLIYAVSEAKGFVLLTGEVGTGKTLLSRLMLRHFQDQIAFAVINHSCLSAQDMLSMIGVEFDLDLKHDDTPALMIRRLQDFLLAKFASNMPTVLILDEAQNLPRDAFEMLRTIGNLEADDAKLLQVLILGQPELRQRFMAQDMRQLHQRVFRSFHLPALSRELCGNYIRHRLQVAGGGDVFDAAAHALIYEASQGLPRLINTICDNAMLSAYSADQKKIDGPFLKTVLVQMTPPGSLETVPAPQHSVIGERVPKIGTPTRTPAAERPVREIRREPLRILEPVERVRYAEPASPAPPPAAPPARRAQKKREAAKIEAALATLDRRVQESEAVIAGLKRQGGETCRTVERMEQRFSQWVSDHDGRLKALMRQSSDVAARAERVEVELAQSRHHQAAVLRQVTSLQEDVQRARQATAEDFERAMKKMEQAEERSEAALKRMTRAEKHITRLEARLRRSRRAAASPSGKKPAEPTTTPPAVEVPAAPASIDMSERLRELMNRSQSSMAELRRVIHDCECEKERAEEVLPPQPDPDQSPERLATPSERLASAITDLAETMSPTA
jgi:type II secretory pathway predicted ATPase ExeA